MIKLFTDQDFNTAKSTDLLKLKCVQCNSEFYKTKKRVKDALNPNKPYDKLDYCNVTCHKNHQTVKVKCTCVECGVCFLRTTFQVNKVVNHFCSQRCSGVYFQKNKKTGTRRSKLEAYLETQLFLIYPTLDIHYNRRDAIDAELDIFIPSLNVAFELNGIFHYEPIYGLDKLEKTITNDKRKFQACLEHNIELCIIDTSHQKYFKEQNSKQYLEIIKNIIDKKLQ